MKEPTDRDRITTNAVAIAELKAWQHGLDKYAEDVIDGKDVEFPLTSLEERLAKLEDAFDKHFTDEDAHPTERIEALEDAAKERGIEADSLIADFTELRKRIEELEEKV